MSGEYIWEYNPDGLVRKERIVRCGDCKRYAANVPDGVVPCEWTRTPDGYCHIAARKPEPLVNGFEDNSRPRWREEPYVDFGEFGEEE